MCHSPPLERAPIGPPTLGPEGRAREASERPRSPPDRGGVWGNLALAIVVESALVLEATIKCPKCTWDSLETSKNDRFGSLLRWSSSPDERQLAAQQMHREEKNHPMSVVQPGLASQAFQEPECQAWGSPAALQGPWEPDVAP